MNKDTNNSLLNTESLNKYDKIIKISLSLGPFLSLVLTAFQYISERTYAAYYSIPESFIEVSFYNSVMPFLQNLVICGAFSFFSYMIVTFCFDFLKKRFLSFPEKNISNLKMTFLYIFTYFRLIIIVLFLLTILSIFLIVAYTYLFYPPFDLINLFSSPKEIILFLVKKGFIFSLILIILIIYLGYFPFIAINEKRWNELKKIKKSKQHQINIVKKLKRTNGIHFLLINSSIKQAIKKKHVVNNSTIEKNFKSNHKFTLFIIIVVGACAILLILAITSIAYQINTYKTKKEYPIVTFKDIENSSQMENFDNKTFVILKHYKDNYYIVPCEIKETYYMNPAGDEKTNLKLEIDTTKYKLIPMINVNVNNYTFDKVSIKK